MEFNLDVDWFVKGPMNLVVRRVTTLKCRQTMLKYHPYVQITGLNLTLDSARANCPTEHITIYSDSYSE